MTPYDELTEAIEIDSRTWAALVRWADDGLKASHEALQVRGVPERDADFYRGQASTFIALLAIDAKRKAVPEEST